VLVYRPTTEPAGWERTANWHDAARIPGVVVAADEDGRQAAMFGANISGQALLYDQNGHLVFHGGLTYARGHAGDNAGRDAIQSSVLTGSSATTETPVFGCYISQAPTQ
jgi:hypothetical protein